MCLQIEWVDEDHPADLNDPNVKAFLDNVVHSSTRSTITSGRYNPGKIPLQWGSIDIRGPLLLPGILNSHVSKLVDSADFEDDGLFCEYAYWLDFENKTMELNGYEFTFKEIREGGWKHGAEAFRAIRDVDALNKDRNDVLEAQNAITEELFVAYRQEEGGKRDAEVKELTRRRDEL